MDFDGADQKQARPVFCFIASKNYVLGYKIYSKEGHMKPKRIELPFRITKNKVSYIDLNNSFLLDKETPHSKILKVKQKETKYIHKQILRLEYANKEFQKAIKQMEKNEKTRRIKKQILV